MAAVSAVFLLSCRVLHCCTVTCNNYLANKMMILNDERTSTRVNNLTRETFLWGALLCKDGYFCFIKQFTLNGVNCVFVYFNVCVPVYFLCCNCGLSVTNKRICYVMLCYRTYACIGQSVYICECIEFCMTINIT